jgi:hypothetical protein
VKRLLWIALLQPFLQPAAVIAADRPIFRCGTPTGVVFADRPCGATSEPYSPDLATVSVMSTVQAEPVKKARPAARPRTSAVVARDTKTESCARIDQSLRKIVSTQRAGYTAKQGVRLDERKRELDNKRRALRC